MRTLHRARLRHATCASPRAGGGCRRSRPARGRRPIRPTDLANAGGRFAHLKYWHATLVPSNGQTLRGRLRRARPLSHDAADRPGVLHRPDGLRQHGRPLHEDPRAASGLVHPETALARQCHEVRQDAQGPRPRQLVGRRCCDARLRLRRHVHMASARTSPSTSAKPTATSAARSSSPPVTARRRSTTAISTSR